MKNSLKLRYVLCFALLGFALPCSAEEKQKECEVHESEEGDSALIVCPVGIIEKKTDSGFIETIVKKFTEEKEAKDGLSFTADWEVRGFQLMYKFNDSISFVAKHELYTLYSENVDSFEMLDTFIAPEDEDIQAFIGFVVLF